MSYVSTAWLLVAATLVLPATPALAQQAINLSLGGFAVTGEDARVDGDVLVANRDILAFDIHDFNTGSVGRRVAAAGRRVPRGRRRRRLHQPHRADVSTTSCVNRDGSEIEQDLKLRIAPFTVTVRLLPFGRSRAVQPYLGGGIGLFNYRYSEVGDFVDFTDRSVFRDQFVAKGTETGARGAGRHPLPDRRRLVARRGSALAEGEADLNDDFLGYRRWTSAGSTTWRRSTSSSSGWRLAAAAGGPDPGTGYTLTDLAARPDDSRASPSSSRSATNRRTSGRCTTS